MWVQPSHIHIIIIISNHPVSVTYAYLFVYKYKNIHLYIGIGTHNGVNSVPFKLIERSAALGLKKDRAEEEREAAIPSQVLAAI